MQTHTRIASQSDLDTLLELNPDYIRSVQTSDVRRFNEILAEDFLCSNPDGTPVNFMVGIKGKSFTAAELEAAGVRRISLAGSLYRMAMTGLLTAAREVKDNGTFGYLDHCVPTPELNALMKA